MKKTFLGAIVLASAIAASGFVLSEVNSQVKSAGEGSEVGIRKLTLTLGQSARSVKMEPALNDQINEEAFIKGVAAYMNQPFDFTYKQGSLSFNVPRTHTLSLFSTESKLSDIAVEIYPLFQDDFEGAFAVVEKWEIFFQQTGLEKRMEKSDVPLNFLKEKFIKFPLIRCGFNTGVWIKDGTRFSIGIDRFEREIYNIDTKKTDKKPVYKVSINIREQSKVPIGKQPTLN